MSKVDQATMFGAILHHIRTTTTKEQVVAIARWVQTYADYYNDLIGVQTLVTQMYLQDMRIDRAQHEQHIIQLQHANALLRQNTHRFLKN